mmetsp:Transcript_114730/g.180648  ORF Transcript_114730/g.180648 Transcript_114730/m.180648 type:complete len:393 (+) Transcript_114730:70-1248(+)
MDGGKEECRAAAANEKLWAEFQRRRRAARLQDAARYTPTKAVLDEAEQSRALASNTPSLQSKKQALISSPSASSPGALTLGAAALSPGSMRKQKAGGSEIQQLLAAVQLERSRQQAARSADAATLRRSPSYPSDIGRATTPLQCSRSEAEVRPLDEAKPRALSPKRLASRSEERRNVADPQLQLQLSTPQRRPVSASARNSSTAKRISTPGRNSAPATGAETKGKESAASELVEPREIRPPLSSGTTKTPQKTPAKSRPLVESESSFIDEDAARCAEKRRTLELPQAFGSVSQQKFAAQLRGQTSPSLNTSFASKGGCTEPLAAWDTSTVCPRSFNGFWGPDVASKVPVRAISRPRMLGPGQQPVPSKELVRWHLMKATHLLESEKSLHMQT